MRKYGSSRVLYAASSKSPSSSGYWGADNLSIAIAPTITIRLWYSVLLNLSPSSYSLLGGSLKKKRRLTGTNEWLVTLAAWPLVSPKLHLSTSQSAHKIPNYTAVCLTFSKIKYHCLTVLTTRSAFIVSWLLDFSHESVCCTKLWASVAVSSNSKEIWDIFWV